MRRPLRASRFMVGNNSKRGSWRLIPQARTQNRVHMAHPSNHTEPRYRSRRTLRGGKLRGQTEISGPGPGRAAARASIRNANGAPDSASGRRTARRPASAECFSRNFRGPFPPAPSTPIPEIQPPKSSNAFRPSAPESAFPNPRLRASRFPGSKFLKRASTVEARP